MRARWRRLSDAQRDYIRIALGVPVLLAAFLAGAAIYVNLPTP
ncbi:hypothetical protein AB1484_29350 [Parafrankia sp. FMc6]